MFISLRFYDSKQSLLTIAMKFQKIALNKFYGQ